jgi:hypothetical protein
MTIHPATRLASAAMTTSSTCGHVISWMLAHTLR